MRILIGNREAVMLVALFIISAATLSCLWKSDNLMTFFSIQGGHALQNKFRRSGIFATNPEYLKRNVATTVISATFPRENTTTIVFKDELERALYETSMTNKTLIISVINKAYTDKEGHGMLDLFLKSFQIGENISLLVNHTLFVTVDQIAFERCKLLHLHCYKLVTEGVDFSKEKIYMSEDFNNMMWRRTLFLGEVLKRGYNFIFTDMDVVWLRNPFPALGPEGEDMQFSVDWFNGQPFNEQNPVNTGFYFASSNNKTIALFDAWYAERNNSKGMKDQDVLDEMKKNGVFGQLGMKVRFLDTLYFAGFCKNNKDFKETRTVHANCCRTVKAKLADLTVVLEEWKSYNGTKTKLKWPKFKKCQKSWRINIKA